MVLLSLLLSKNIALQRLRREDLRKRGIRLLLGVWFSKVVV
jgi:hypothetical protein